VAIVLVIWTPTSPSATVEIELLEEVQETRRPVSLVALAMTKPDTISSAANSEVVPCRT